ncbi:MAG: OmpH family outer membrane protein [Verrucomicrobiaceae bacterium]
MNKHFATRLLSLILLFGISLPAAAAPLKVATVDMRKLLTEYHVTKAAEAEDQVEREDIKKDDMERIAAIKAMEEEMRKLRVQFQEEGLAEEKKKEIARQFGEREQTLVALRRERQEFIQRRTGALNAKMVAKMKEIREAVGKKVEEQAAASGVDYAFDSTGLTTSQVPFVLYVRNRVDITDDVLKLLNADAPAE